ncbi:hypothetical protein NQ318_017793 [Aromia moschata]|uniref:Uncharacterized protein n=1 Tax=Aromia moschata TaxID=1265417 RepID=A0AAV8XUY3_9CUCU|nr:hypothetical protein NQ318_017793 [Aromia moschata]
MIFNPMKNRLLEYESEIKRCTLALLKLILIINYVHVERGKDSDPYFSKLVQYYKRNKSRFRYSG